MERKVGNPSLEIPHPHLLRVQALSGLFPPAKDVHLLIPLGGERPRAALRLWQLRTANLLTLTATIRNAADAVLAGCIKL